MLKITRNDLISPSFKPQSISFNIVNLSHWSIELQCIQSHQLNSVLLTYIFLLIIKNRAKIIFNFVRHFNNFTKIKVKGRQKTTTAAEKLFFSMHKFQIMFLFYSFVDIHFALHYFRSQEVHQYDHLIAIEVYRWKRYE